MHETHYNSGVIHCRGGYFVLDASLGDFSVKNIKYLIIELQQNERMIWLMENLTVKDAENKFVSGNDHMTNSFDRIFWDEIQFQLKDSKERHSCGACC